MLKGLPASGKSTYAKELVAQGYKRVNKDDLRGMIDDSKFNKTNEEYVKNIETELVRDFIRNGLNVVVDDTNFAYEEHWENVASSTENSNVEFEVKFFDTPVHECIERDAKRGDKSVGAKVILDMYFRYVQPEKLDLRVIGKKGAFIFDIDGTLSHMNGRSPYDYTKVGTDTVDEHVAYMCNILKNSGFKIIIVSGREDSCLEETKKWLNDNFVNFDELYMRFTGDKRDDRIIKKEIYDKCIKDSYVVVGVFDDRDRVVGMWRGLGLTCYQVNYGSF